MRPLSAVELLNVWERGREQAPGQQALALLAAACPDTPPEELAQLSIGRRDARLLTLREWTFGPQLAALTGCPHCDERLEMTFDAADIRVPQTEPPEVMAVDALEYEVRFRLPTGKDVLAIAGAEVEDARRQLLSACVLHISRNGEVKPAAELPAEVAVALAARMADLDAQADVQLALTCPACRHRWSATFDIVSFFWTEIYAWAQRILREVHTLASAYGWRETDILALSPWRRQYYLQMVGS